MLENVLYNLTESLPLGSCVELSDTRRRGFLMNYFTACSHSFLPLEDGNNDIYSIISA